MHWSEEICEMDDDEAMEVLSHLRMESLELFDAEQGIVWEAFLEFKGNRFRAEHFGMGRCTQYRCVDGDAAALKTIQDAVNQLIKAKEPLDLLVSYMMPGDKGSSQVYHARRDFDAIVS